jgi:IS30 family transposase
MSPKIGRSHKFDEATRRKLFLLVDKGMTVRGAALELGISPNTAYMWRSKAGVSSPRRASRNYTDQDKAEFFRRLELNRNVTAVAREMDFVRITCFKWAHDAGIYTGRDVSPKRDEFLRLRAEGIARADAARRVGAASRSAADWDLGIRQIHYGRVYPDGRIVRYNMGAAAKMKYFSSTQSYGPIVELERLDRAINPRYLALAERERIHDLRTNGMSIRSIARELDRAPSTISRELMRNTTSSVGYLPYAAQRAATIRRQRPRERKLLSEGPLRDYVSHRLAKRWSPEQICQRMVKDFPDDETMRVSTETVYQAIYVQARGALKRELVSTLRRGQSERQPRRSPTHRTSRFVSPMTSIAERPDDVELRLVPGHWEGDLIVGPLHRSAIATLVERTTRYTMLAHLDRDHNADTVRDGLISVVKGLPKSLRHTLTWDQGAEMSQHASFSMATDMKVYFCDPASPWQRGSNENTNGLLRQYFPKGTDLSKYSVEHLQSVANELNDRPRKTLEWDSPAERLSALLETAK